MITPPLDEIDQTLADAQATLALLEEKGWSQGSWCNYNEKTDQPQEFCLGGAMAYAINGGRDASANFLRPEEQVRFNRLARAMDLPHQSGHTPTDWVVVYNDEVAKAVYDVRTVLIGAITRLRLVKATAGLRTTGVDG